MHVLRDIRKSPRSRSTTKLKIWCSSSSNRHPPAFVVSHAPCSPIIVAMAAKRTQISMYSRE